MGGKQHTNAIQFPVGQLAGDSGTLEAKALEHAARLTTIRPVAVAVHKAIGGGNKWMNIFHRQLIENVDREVRQLLIRLMEIGGKNVNVGAIGELPTVGVLSKRMED